ncbi:type II toxin-antitoxin system VapC family toxin [Hydrogenophaga sp. BPS33]|uniref:type II toxin-antitoxin system VapC family toxin n=1 Tax=Hydrogenophaga sp. BPS33 TaxID=2651974 RepID=UPI00131FBD84|nr:type II toxin-antitoxin system VapC family toxin [Hydrogenophaga sp. BPS33]QHE86025.1 type II toxin-antitoxin system VapC family toxin [Hydrogenophaga sp. BPS33]
MILVDTSVWIDHLRSSDAALVERLHQGAVLGHPFVTGELALGSLRQRAAVLEALRALPQATPARDDEVLLFVEQHALHGLGIGWVDAHLLAATRLTAGAQLWTRDKRLLATCQRLGLAHQAAH